MIKKKKSRRQLFGAAIVVLLILIAIPFLFISNKPTGKIVYDNQQNNVPIIQQPIIQQTIPVQRPQDVQTTPRDEKCRVMNIDFDTCMAFIDKLCFSDSDCGPFLCKSNKCSP